VPGWRAVPVAAGRGPGAASRAPVLPWCGDDARRRRCCTRSHGRQCCPGVAASPPAARPSLPAGGARRRSRACWLWKTWRPSLLGAAQTASRPSGGPARSRLSLRPCRPRVLVEGATRRGGGPFLGELGSRGGRPRRGRRRIDPRSLDRRPMRRSRVPVFSLCPHDRGGDPGGLCPASPRAAAPIRCSSGVQLSTVPPSWAQASWGGDPLRDHTCHTPCAARYSPC
jgi:hypothetical protein